MPSGSRAFCLPCRMTAQSGGVLGGGALGGDGGESGGCGRLGGECGGVGHRQALCVVGPAEVTLQYSLVTSSRRRLTGGTCRRSWWW